VIRLCNLDDQIEEDECCFAFYDTVTCTFLTIYGEQVWRTVDELSAVTSHDGTDSVLRARLIEMAKTAGYGTCTSKWGQWRCDREPNHEGCHGCGSYVNWDG
jgi:hypothetical protein